MLNLADAKTIVGLAIMFFLVAALVPFASLAIPLLRSMDVSIFPTPEPYYFATTSLQNLITISAIVTAAVIAGRNGLLSRKLDPHVSIDHKTTHQQLDSQNAHVRVQVALHNASGVPVQIRRSAISVERLARTTAGHYGYSDIGGNLLRDRSTTFVQHPILDNREFHLADLEVIIESGQSRQETFEIIIDPDNVPIRIHTRFRGGLPNAQEASDKDWEAISFYDID